MEKNRPTVQNLNNYPNTEVARGFQTVELRHESYYVHQAISDEELMRACTLEESRDEYNRVLLRRLRYDVLTENLKETLRVDDFPTWWDHFKRDVVNPFLKYLWESWSVSFKMNRKELTAKALYPKLTLSLKEKEPVVRFQALKEVQLYSRPPKISKSWRRE